MFAITHPIRQLISSQYGFLSSMLDRFPSLLNEWIQKQEEEVKQFAKELAEGDPDVYLTTYNNEISRVDPCYYEEQLLYQAMMIMVYSYYESSLLRLAKETQVKEARPSEIAGKYGIKLDDESLKISEYLYNTIEPLRNQLCHNNQGTLFEKKNKRREDDICNINKLVERNYITIDDGRITSIDKGFIKNILVGEYKLLTKLAEICGFTTVLI